MGVGGQVQEHVGMGKQGSGVVRWFMVGSDL